MSTPPPRKLLLIGWDSADWKLLSPLMDSGQMPALARLVEEGCMGQISTLHPVYSPMLWTSIATGKRPYKHGILGFSEPLPDGSGVRPVSTLSRKTKAFWNIFHQQGWRGNVVGWWPSHPAEPIRGGMISNLCHHAVGPEEQEWPLPPAGVQPAEWRETLADLRVHPNDFTPAHLEPFIPKAREIDQDKDHRLTGCMKTLAEAATVHSWALHLIDHTEWDYMAVYYDAMDHFGHGFMKYHPPRRAHISKRDFELYSGVMAQAARFHDMMLAALLSKVPPDTTVLLLSDHGFHPGEGRPDRLAPIPAGPAEEHSDFGIFVVRGPGLKCDHLLHGTSVLDITPTLLVLQGLPVGADMDGRPVLDAWAQPPAVDRIPSWDAVAGDDGSHPADLQTDPESERAALEQLIALGYVQRPPDNIEEAVRETQRELDMNRAEALIDGGCEADALPILRELCAQWPEEWRFHLRLAMACKTLGRVDKLREVVERLQARRPECEAAREELKTWREEIKKRAEKRKAEIDAEKSKIGDGKLQSGDRDSEIGDREADAEGEAERTPDSELRTPLLTPEERKTFARITQLSSLNTHGLDFLRAVVALAEKRPTDALELLGEAEKGMARRPGLYLQTGETYQRLARWREAEESFRRALTLDPENPHAFVGLARCLLARRQWYDAAGAALTAIQRLHRYPLAHFLLGVALLRQGALDRAAHALEETLRINPAFWPAHLRLARLRRTADPARAAWHLAQARTARERAAGIASGNLPQDERMKKSEGAGGSVPPSAAGPASSAFIPHPSSFPPALLGPPRAPFGAEVVTLVTGLPRSGTSLLMQMLAAGGLEPLTDHQRTADADNPRGYFELEAVKSLKTDNAILQQAAGKAVKVVLPLLPHVPPELRYHVLLIERDLDEIFASQRAMLDRGGQSAHDPDTLRPAYERLLRQNRQALAASPIVRTLHLHHRWVIEHPAEAARAIASFLGGDLDVSRMAAAVDSALHRQVKQLEN